MAEVENFVILNVIRSETSDMASSKQKIVGCALSGAQICSNWL
jgi:hypothetical protein